MFKNRPLLAALMTLGLFCISVGLWTIYSQKYRTDKVPESFEVIGFLEQKSFFDLPGFALYDLDLKKVGLETLPKNKVYIVSFWASWCEPCAEEFPSMVKLVNQYPEVEILAISNDTEREDIDSFAQALKLRNNPRIRLYWDKDKSLAKLFKIDRLPESFIFNKQGRLEKKIVGSRDWAAPDATSFFGKLSAN